MNFSFLLSLLLLLCLSCRMEAPEVAVVPWRPISKWRNELISEKKTLRSWSWIFTVFWRGLCNLCVPGVYMYTLNYVYFEYMWMVCVSVCVSCTGPLFTPLSSKHHFPPLRWNTEELWDGKEKHFHQQKSVCDRVTRIWSCWMVDALIRSPLNECPAPNCVWLRGLKEIHMTATATRIETNHYVQIQNTTTISSSVKLITWNVSHIFITGLAASRWKVQQFFIKGTVWMLWSRSYFNIVTYCRWSARIPEIQRAGSGVMDCSGQQIIF